MKRIEKKRKKRKVTKSGLMYHTDFFRREFKTRKIGMDNSFIRSEIQATFKTYHLKWFGMVEANNAVKQLVLVDNPIEGNNV